MLVVQMVLKVSLGLLAQLLAQVGIIDESAHGLCQLVGIAWRNEQAIATVFYVFALTTIIRDNHRMQPSRTVEARMPKSAPAT